jgi:hypothetical protein
MVLWIGLVAKRCPSGRATRTVRIIRRVTRRMSIRRIIGTIGRIVLGIKMIALIIIVAITRNGRIGEEPTRDDKGLRLVKGDKDRWAAISSQTLSSHLLQYNP